MKSKNKQVEEILNLAGVNYEEVRYTGCIIKILILYDCDLSEASKCFKLNYLITIIAC